MQYTLFSESNNVNSIPQREEGVRYDDTWLLPHLPGDNRIYCVIVDRRILQGSQCSLSEFYENDRLVHAIQCKQYPIEMVRMLYMIQTALCDLTPPDKDSPPKLLTFEDDGNYLERVEQYIEEIKQSDDVVIGWRIWYVVNDKTFDLSEEISQAIVRFDVENKKRKRQYSEANNTLRFLEVTSQEQWITSVMDSYVENGLDNNPTVYHNDMKYMSNPAHLNYHCSFTASCETIRRILPNAAIRYSNESRYKGGKFPSGARKLGIKDKRPAVFHHALLIENDYSRMELAGLTDKQRHRMINGVQEQQVKRNHLYSDLAVDVVAQSLDMNKRQFAMWTPAAVRNSSQYLARLVVLFSNPELFVPGHAACERYIMETRNRHLVDDTVFPGVRIRGARQDNKMSHFAHMMSRDLYLFEDLVGIMVFHQELQMLNIWRLGAFDSREDVFFSHKMITGAAAAGKSEILKRMIQLCCEGTVREASYETAKANTTGENYDALIFAYDEMPPHIMDEGPGKQGDSLVKTQLSKGKIRTRTIEIDEETRKRKAVDYECSMKGPVIMNGNIPGSALAEPIASRLGVHEVSRYVRDYADFLLKDNKMIKNPDQGAKFDAAKDDYRFIQAMASRVELMIKAGFLPQIELTCALLHWNLIKEQLMKQNILMLPRTELQILTGFRTTCLYDAITRVFFTTDVFPAGKAYEDTDMLAILPFLFATEEHVIYTLTQMEGVIIDTNLDTMMITAKKMCTGNDNTLKFAEDENKNVDYNYVMLVTPGVEVTASAVLDKAANMIVRAIQRTDKINVLQANVLASLKAMQSQVVEHVKYTGAGELPDVVDEDQVAPYPMLRIKLNQANKCGIEINRCFLRSCTTRESTILDQAIVNSATDMTPRRHLITGKTFRIRKEMYPYLYRTMHRQPITSKPTLIINCDHSVPGCSLAVDGVANTTNTNKFERIGESIDQHCYRDFATRNGITYAPLHFPVDMRWESTTYPEAQITAQKASMRRENLPLPGRKEWLPFAAPVAAPVAPPAPSDNMDVVDPPAQSDNTDNMDIEYDMMERDVFG